MPLPRELPALALLVAGLLVGPSPRRLRVNLPEVGTDPRRRARLAYEKVRVQVQAEQVHALNRHLDGGLGFNELAAMEEQRLECSREETLLLLEGRLSRGGAKAPPDWGRAGEPESTPFRWTMDWCRGSRSEVAWCRVDASPEGTRVLRFRAANAGWNREWWFRPTPRSPCPLLRLIGGGGFSGDSPADDFDVTAEEGRLAAAPTRVAGLLLAGAAEWSACPERRELAPGVFPEFIGLEWGRWRAASGGSAGRTHGFPLGDARTEAVVTLLEESLWGVAFHRIRPGEPDIEWVDGLRGRITDADWYRRYEKALRDALDL